MNKQAFLQGFMEKCADYDLTLTQAQELLKRAIDPATLSALIGAGGGALAGGIYGGLGDEGSLGDAVLYGGVGALGGGAAGFGGYKGYEGIMALVDKFMPEASAAEKIKIVQSLPPEVVEKLAPKLNTSIGTDPLTSWDGEVSMEDWENQSNSEDYASQEVDSLGNLKSLENSGDIIKKPSMGDPDDILNNTYLDDAIANARSLEDAVSGEIGGLFNDEAGDENGVLKELFGLKRNKKDYSYLDPEYLKPKSTKDYVAPKSKLFLDSDR